MQSLYLLICYCSQWLWVQAVQPKTPQNGAVITNKLLHKNGLKEFTVLKNIRGNNCACSCLCTAPDSVGGMAELQLEDPSNRTLGELIRQPVRYFQIAKEIRANQCKCSCACTEPSDDILFGHNSDDQNGQVTNSDVAVQWTKLDESPASSTMGTIDSNELHSERLSINQSIDVTTKTSDESAAINQENTPTTSKSATTISESTATTQSMNGEDIMRSTTSPTFPANTEKDISTTNSVSASKSEASEIRNASSTNDETASTTASDKIHLPEMTTESPQKNPSNLATISGPGDSPNSATVSERKDSPELISTISGSEYASKLDQSKVTTPPNYPKELTTIIDRGEDSSEIVKISDQMNASDFSNVSAPTVSQQISTISNTHAKSEPATTIQQKDQTSKITVGSIEVHPSELTTVFHSGHQAENLSTPNPSSESSTLPNSPESATIASPVSVSSLELTTESIKDKVSSSNSTDPTINKVLLSASVPTTVYPTVTTSDRNLPLSPPPMIENANDSILPLDRKENENVNTSTTDTIESETETTLDPVFKAKVANMLNRLKEQLYRLREEEKRKNAISLFASATQPNATESHVSETPSATLPNATKSHVSAASSPTQPSATESQVSAIASSVQSNATKTHVSATPSTTQSHATKSHVSATPSATQSHATKSHVSATSSTTQPNATESHVSETPSATLPNATKSHLSATSSATRPSAIESQVSATSSATQPNATESHVSETPSATLPNATEPQLSATPSTTQSHATKSHVSATPSATQSHATKSHVSATPSTTQSHATKSHVSATSPTTQPNATESHVSETPSATLPNATKSHLSATSSATRPSATESQVSATSSATQPNATESHVSETPSATLPNATEPQLSATPSTTLPNATKSHLSATSSATQSNATKSHVSVTSFATQPNAPHSFAHVNATSATPHNDTKITTASSTTQVNSAFYSLHVLSVAEHANPNVNSTNSSATFIKQQNSNDLAGKTKLKKAKVEMSIDTEREPEKRVPVLSGFVIGSSVEEDEVEEEEKHAEKKGNSVVDEKTDGREDSEGTTATEKTDSTNGTVVRLEKENTMTTEKTEKIKNSTETTESEKLESDNSTAEATLSPVFRARVANLLNRLKEQLYKMRELQRNGMVNIEVPSNSTISSHSNSTVTDQLPTKLQTDFSTPSIAMLENLQRKLEEHTQEENKANAVKPTERGNEEETVDGFITEAPENEFKESTTATLTTIENILQNTTNPSILASTTSEAYNLTETASEQKVAPDDNKLFPLSNDFLVDAQRNRIILLPAPPQGKAVFMWPSTDQSSTISSAEDAINHESNTTEGAGANKTSGIVEQGSFKDFDSSTPTITTTMTTIIVGTTRKVPIAIPLTTMPTAQSMIERLETARRLREEQVKLEMMEAIRREQLGTDEPDPHLEERRREIELKLLQLAQAERFHREMLERQRQEQDVGPTVATDAESGRTASVEAQLKRTASDADAQLCVPVRRFVRQFHIDNPQRWIQQNCQLAKRHFPNASCNEIGTLLAQCVVVQTAQFAGETTAEEQNEEEEGEEDDE